MVSEIRRESYPGPDELKQALVGAGVVHGIKADALVHMYRERICGRRVEAARGDAPTPGEAGRLKAHVDISAQGRPKLLRDGSVDHKNLQRIHNVHAGQVLLERIPPVRGKPGKSVSGEVIAAPQPTDVALRAGPGTTIASDNPNRLIAAIDGAVTMNARGVMEVQGTKVVGSDIDYGTGSISFVGSLTISGTVRAGFAVKAAGDLSIGGSVEDAQVVCAGALEIAGGAIGSHHGELVAGGSVRVHHLEGFTVRALGDVTVEEDAVHCRIEAEGAVKARTIIGGTVVAGKGVRAGVIGAMAEAKTVLDMGGVYRLRLQKEEALRKMGHYAIDLAATKQQMFTLVREGMDETGTLRPDRTAELMTLKKARRALTADHARLEHEIERVSARLETAPHPSIKARHLYPNTVVRFGPLERTVREEMENVVISASGDKIIFSSKK
jgi:hypothetical protein